MSVGDAKAVDPAKRRTTARFSRVIAIVNHGFSIGILSQLLLA